MKKLLITGKERSLLNEMLKFVPTAYETDRCHVVYKPFDEALAASQPDVVFLCLDSETEETIKVFASLSNSEAQIVVVGKKSDCVLFQKNISSSFTTVLVRPFKAQDIVDALAKFADGCTVLKEDADLEEVFPDTSTLEELKAADNEIKDMSEDKLIDDLLSLVNDFQEKKHILVVDDDVNMLKIIKTFLEDRYIVHVAPNGRMAEKFLETNSVNLILLDYIMPIKTGPQVLRELRENPATAAVPVIFLTGVSERNKIEEIIDYKPNGYILKPVDKSSLLQRVDDAISRHKF